MQQLATIALIGLVMLGVPAEGLAMSFNEFEAIWADARRASSGGHYEEALAAAARLQRIAPHHPGVESIYARSAARAGRVSDAVDAYARLIDQGYGGLVARDPDFAALRGRAQKAERLLLRSQFDVLAPSRLAFRLADPHTIPEGLAFDPHTKSFLVSSNYLRKIIVRKPSGHFRDFVQSGDHGLLPVQGLKVGRSTPVLFACIGTDDNHYQNAVRADLGRSALFVFDLTTGTVQSATWADDGRFHLFNDLVEGPDGSVYITDSRDGRIYSFDPNTTDLSPLTDPNSLLYPNGIAIDPTGRFLFVADLVGIVRFDIATKEMRRLSEPHNVSSAGIDGLYYFRGDLIGIQNGFGVNRIMAFHLNGASETITGARALARDDPRMKEATEGVIVGSSLYFLADNQQNAFSPDGALELHGLRRALVLKLPLRGFAAPDKVERTEAAR